MLQKFDLNI